MKAVLIAASAIVALSGIAVANAQETGPTYSNTIHQSAGDRDSRGTPKYNQSGRRHYQHPMSSRRYSRDYMRSGAPSTTGAGPYYENTIHQSKGRDARGTPKTYGGQ